MSDDLRIAIAHDWLIRFAGSERCVRELLREFPGSPILTALAIPGALPEDFAHAEPSILQRIPGATRHHEWFLPLMPAAWRLRAPVEGVDALLSSSHACAKAVRAAAGVPHLCYCHTPMRYAWDFASEQGRFPRGSRSAARALMAGFRRWDRHTASRVTVFVANSRAVARRIRRCYGRTAQVVPPPVDTDFFTPGGARSGRFLYVGRLVAYKRAGLVIEAFRGLPHELVVIGDGGDGDILRASLPSNVTMIPYATPWELREHFRRSTALVFPADEDFGIAMAESQACGTPVIGLAAGGALDIVEHGRTGWLIDAPTVTAVRRAIEVASRTGLDVADVRASAERFSAPRFRARMRQAIEEMVLEHRTGRVLARA